MAAITAAIRLIIITIGLLAGKFVKSKINPIKEAPCSKSLLE
jgi:hypothetical protein